MLLMKTAFNGRRIGSRISARSALILIFGWTPSVSNSARSADAVPSIATVSHSFTPGRAACALIHALTAPSVEKRGSPSGQSNRHATLCSTTQTPWLVSSAICRSSAAMIVEAELSVP